MVWMVVTAAGQLLFVVTERSQWSLLIQTLTLLVVRREGVAALSEGEMGRERC